MTAFRGQERKRSYDTSRSEGEAGAEFKESEMHPEPWILSWRTIQGPVCATNADQDLSGNWEGGLARLQSQSRLKRECHLCTRRTECELAAIPA